VTLSLSVILTITAKNFAEIGAVKVAVRKNLVAVKALKVAVVLSGSGSDGLMRPGNPAITANSTKF